MLALAVGDLELTYEVVKLMADDELTMFAYTAEAGSRSDETLKLLASWAATLMRPWKGSSVGLGGISGVQNAGVACPVR